MKHELQWGGLQRESKKRGPLSIAEYRNMFPRYPWAIIDTTAERKRLPSVHQAMTHSLTEGFVNHVLASYTPSPKRLLLILPCSKAKPYSLSPSYLNIWRPLIFLFVGRDIKDEKCPIDVLVMSGMIGPVPLKLEEYEPAPNYDFSLNAVKESEAAELFQLLAQRMSKYLTRTLGFYEEVYSLVNKAYNTVIELSLKQIQIQNRDALKKIHTFPVSSSNLPALTEVMIRLKKKLHPNDKSPQEVGNRRYFMVLRKRLRIASKIICKLDPRVLC